MRPWTACLLLLLLGYELALAQDTPPPPAVTRVEKKEKRTWTNDDLEKLSGTVNVLGDKAAPASKEADPAAAAKKTKEEEKCESDAWVAAVTAVLKAQGLPYDRRFWSEKIFGDACTSNVSPGAVAGRIDGNYTLDDGRKLRIGTTVTSGLPAAPVIVGSADENRPLIVKWKGQPLVMTKFEYIDRQYNYVSQYSISSLMLTNLLTGRVLIFDMKTNSEKEIEGTLQFKVEKRP